jgi:DNA mismatch repair protein MutS2
MVYPDNFENKTGFDKIRQKLISHCLSPLGIHRAEEMTFSNSFSLIKKQLSLTNELKTICLTDENFPVSYYFDLTWVLSRLKIEGSFPDIEDLFNLHRSLETIKSIYLFFKARGQQKYPNLFELVKNLKLYPYVTDRINVIITNQGKIKDNASAKLADIRKEIAVKEKEVSKRMNSILKKAQNEGWAEENAMLSVREGRLVIPLNATNKRRVQGIVHDESSTGKTSFVEPAEVVELNNDLKDLEYAERREIVKILTDFSNDIRPYIDDLLNGYYILAEIDFLRAKALFAIEIQAVEPPISNMGIVDWHNAVHPLLYLHFKAEGKEVIPLHIKLNSQQRILVISGPNAGGKSVCLQTLGLLQYMLQCGMLIPVKETSEAGIFNHLFIDIGDEQSIENDLSTYSSHLINMKYFLRNADKSTLFLIDEFGSGTEPMLGGAIAESILESLNNLTAFGVVTTHYTNLKHFASSSAGIINGAMLFDTRNLQPVFKLEIGEPGSSFAFEIARKIGLPEQILKAAEDKVGEKHIDYDKNLKEIIRDKHYWQFRRNQVKESGKHLDQLLERYSSELDEIDRLRKEILHKAKTDAQELLSGVNKEIENTIRTIRESNAEKEKTKNARHQITQLKHKTEDFDALEDERISKKINQLNEREKRKRNKLKKEENSAKIEIRKNIAQQNISIGDKVKLFGQDLTGEVLDVNNKSILVAFGNMTTTLHENRLEKISNNEFRKLQKQNPVNQHVETYNLSERKLNFKPQIDVRGMRADVATQNVADFIDDAVAVNASEVKILHGKGNGILRQVIRDYLSTLDFVMQFNDEHIDFGGAGITVVKL